MCAFSKFNQFVVSHTHSHASSLYLRVQPLVRFGDLSVQNCFITLSHRILFVTWPKIFNVLPKLTLSEFARRLQLSSWHILNWIPIHISIRSIPYSTRNSISFPLMRSEDSCYENVSSYFWIMSINIWLRCSALSFRVCVSKSSLHCGCICLFVTIPGMSSIEVRQTTKSIGQSLNELRA